MVFPFDDQFDTLSTYSTLRVRKPLNAVLDWLRVPPFQKCQERVSRRFREGHDLHHHDSETTHATGSVDIELDLKFLFS